MGDVQVGQPRALRLARRPRGVQDHRGVLLVDGGDGCGRCGAGRAHGIQREVETGGCAEPARSGGDDRRRRSAAMRAVAAGGRLGALSGARGIDRDAPAQRRYLGRIGHAIDELGIEDDRARAALRQHVGEAGALLADPDRHRDQPEPLRGKQHEDELGPVADQHREAIAAFEAERVQPGGEAFDLRVGLLDRSSAGPGRRRRRARPGLHRAGEKGNRLRGRSAKQRTMRPPASVSRRIVGMASRASASSAVASVAVYGCPVGPDERDGPCDWDCDCDWNEAGARDASAGRVQSAHRHVCRSSSSRPRHRQHRLTWRRRGSRPVRSRPRRRPGCANG